MKAIFWGRRTSVVVGAVLNAAKLIVFLTGCIVLLSAFALAQKTIIIDESLSANADKMNVKMGLQVGEVWKFRFGDYAVVSPKLTVTTGTSKTNIWGSRTETKSKRKFLYSVKGPTPDTARVNAAQNIDVKTSQSIEILSNISLGSDEVLAETDNFVASITINEDGADTWTLIMNVVRRTGGEGGKPKSFLTNGVRKILLIPVTSNKDGDARGTPALGYDLSENGQALGAVQYYSGGLFTFGVNKNFIYILRNLEPKMKLVLAAAMTAVMQVKVRTPKF
jgi:hypothetical protein